MSRFYGMNEHIIREYARLIVRMGINVQPGQEVVIKCPVEHYEFARLLIEESYVAGAAEVIMQWSDNRDLRLFYENVSDQVLSTVPQWKAESYNYYAKRGAGFISISGNDPESFKGVDPRKMQLRSVAMDKAVEDYNKLLMASEVPWTVAAVPQKQWAKKVFPGCSEEEAMQKLWKKILQAVRIGGQDMEQRDAWDDGQGVVRSTGCGQDAVQAWRTHDTFLKEKCQALNHLAFTKLHYKNSLGTDFTVGLVKNHIWEGGSETAGNGVVFEANIPTEEIFTMPDKNVAEGTLVGALPLSFRGSLIKNFTLTFHEGQVVDYTAEEGLESLKTLLESDEGSRRLGEVALVPYSSPISRMKTLFYNTLFDENASCHFALGECYPTTVKGGTKMSEEELSAIGANSSMNHVDFMVGTEDLTITGIKENGEEVVLFEKGNWSIM